MTNKQIEVIQKKYGFSRLLGTQFKIDKSNKSGSGYYTLIMHLAAHKSSGKNVCPMATKGCSAGCLMTAGHGVYQHVQNKRINRTKFFFSERKAFIDLLIHELSVAHRRAAKRGDKLAIRLNGTSDIAWERIAPKIFTMFPDVQFYDYTKVPSRMEGVPKNYKLIFSRSENNEETTLNILRKGHNVAVVFKNYLPERWKRFKVIDGDETDERFLDKHGVVVGLKAKGRAKRDVSGFVI